MTSSSPYTRPMLAAVLLSVLLIAGCGGPEAPERSELEPIYGPRLTDPVRIGGPMDHWRAYLSPKIPNDLGDNLPDGVVQWYYGIRGDSAYAVPAGSPLTCRPFIAGGSDSTRFDKCRAIQTKGDVLWSYRLRYVPGTGRGQAVVTRTPSSAFPAPDSLPAGPDRSAARQ
jgi:hypothetical protein